MITASVLAWKRKIWTITAIYLSWEGFMDDNSLSHMGKNASLQWGQICQSQLDDFTVGQSQMDDITVVLS